MENEFKEPKIVRRGYNEDDEKFFKGELQQECGVGCLRWALLQELLGGPDV